MSVTIQPFDCYFNSSMPQVNSALHRLNNTTAHCNSGYKTREMIENKDVYHIAWRKTTFRCRCRCRCECLKRNLGNQHTGYKNLNQSLQKQINFYIFTFITKAGKNINICIRLHAWTLYKHWPFMLSA